MKKNYILFFTIMCFTFIVNSSCEDKEKKFVVDTKELTFDFAQNEQEVNIISGTPWSAVSSADWCIIPLATGSGNGSFKITTTLNDSRNMREAIVWVMNEKGSESIIVKQSEVPDSEESFNLDSINITFSSAGMEKRTLKLTSKGEWKLDASSKPTWIKITPASGSGNAEIGISVDRNSLLFPRSSSLVFTNTILKKSILLNVNQTELKQDILSDYKYLGKGYDASKEYALDNAVCDKVLDWNKLAERGYLAEIIYPKVTDENYFYGKTVSEYQKALSVKAGLDANYKGFSASVNSTFNTEALGASENEFAMLRTITQKAIVSLNGNIDAEKLRECMTNSAFEDINNPNLSVASIVDRYGTHVVPSFVLGTALDYSMTVDMASSEDKIEWSLAVKAGYNSIVGGGNVSGEVEESKKISLYGVNKKESLKARGGESQYATIIDGKTHDRWLQSAENPNGWVMVSFGKLSLIPIWQLASNEERRVSLEKYTSDYLKGIQIISKQTHKNFSIEMIKAKYKGAESNHKSENTQDIDITNSMINVNKQPSYKFIKNIRAARIPNINDKNDAYERYRSFGTTSIGNGISKKFSLSEIYPNEVKLTFDVEIIEYAKGYASIDLVYDVNIKKWKNKDTQKIYSDGDEIELSADGKNKWMKEAIIAFKLNWK